MPRIAIAVFALSLAPLALVGCSDHTATGGSASDASALAEEVPVAERVDRYKTVRLERDLGDLTADQKTMVGLMIDAAQAMDEAFWIQAWGPRDEMLDTVADPAMRRYVEINYGPWDRLDGNEPFVPGVGPKPAGANFYPADMTKDELETAAKSDEELTDLYTMVRRDSAGKLEAVPYSRFFAAQVQRAADKLRRASALASDPGLKRYLELRAEALESDDYRPSDLAWLDMKDNLLDVVIGPIETYEDQLFGYKASFESYVLIKDLDWSRRLARYAQMLPELQRGLPVAEEYKSENPGTDSDLNAYDAVYYAGDCNAGSKTIAINLPNDETVQAEKGSRRLQLKNAMQAKFDEILVPIAGVLIAEDQRPHVTFDAFFADTMFHEVAHGLGIKHTLDGRSTVREALREQASALEEGKADVLGLYMITKLHDKGEIDGALEDYYTTFLAGIFRSVRFGTASAHGNANMIRFNFFRDRGAFSRDEATGTYRVDMDKMRAAVDALSERILVLQGNGDYEAARSFADEEGRIPDVLARDLARLNERGIPVDVVFEQGRAVLGLPPAE